MQIQYRQYIFLNYDICKHTFRVDHDFYQLQQDILMKVESVISIAIIHNAHILSIHGGHTVGSIFPVTPHREVLIANNRSIVEETVLYMTRVYR